jgi:hypothetical protein
VGAGEILGGGCHSSALRRAQARSEISSHRSAALDSGWSSQGCRGPAQGRLRNDRLREGFETKKKPGKRNDERKIYKSEIASYYRWREVEKRHLAGGTIDQACTGASEFLRGTDFKGVPETMRKDHQRVSRDLKNPTRAYRYYSAMPETREITDTGLAPKVKTEK